MKYQIEAKKNEVLILNQYFEVRDSKEFSEFILAIEIQLKDESDQIIIRRIGK